jgi:hypothetical protein
MICSSNNTKWADYQHAVLKKKVADEIKTMFENEGNLFLYEMRIAEAAGVKSAIEAGSAARYL